MFKRWWWIFPVVGSIGASAGLLGAAVITFFQPRIYESEGILTVRQPTVDPHPEKRMRPREFSMAESRTIVGPENLEAVVDDLRRQYRWQTNPHGAVEKLRESVRCEVSPVTNAISIRARSPSRDEARDIARSVMTCYKSRKSEPSDSGQIAMVADLMLAIETQKEKTIESRDRWLDSRKSRQSDPGQLLGIDVEKKYDADMRSLQELAQKLDEAYALIDASRVSVAVLKIPQTPEQPASPDVTANLSRGIMLGMLLSPLLSVAVIAVLNRLSPAAEDDASVRLAQAPPPLRVPARFEPTDY